MHNDVYSVSARKHDIYSRTSINLSRPVLSIIRIVGLSTKRASGLELG